MSMPESEIEEIFQAHGWIRAWTQENGSPDTTKILDVDVKRRTFNQAAGEPIPVGLDGPFRRWLVSIETELIQRLTSDCGQFPDWKSVYIGSLKKFPRCHETLSLSVKLQQIGVPPNKAAGAERPAFKIPRDCPPGLMCPVSDRGFSIGSATELGSHGIPQMAVGARYASEFTTGNDSSPIGDFTAKPRQLRQAQNEKLMAAINDYVSSRCEPESYDKKLATEGSRSNAQMDYLSQYESLPIRAPIFDPQMGVIRTLNDSKKRSIGSDIADLTAPYESQPPYKRLKGGGSSKEGSMLSTSPPWRAKTPSRAFGILETGTANEPLDSGYHPDVASDFYPNQMTLPILRS
ncbi:hypothetical protein M7I_1014 [Glarea lozoyensis 74030]|uniref:Uncharacterized protein n=1 Tax=Glarea lozoyensis (strain ATCC 74030 / MF5533) TaxID=1104152 RepID=H0EEX7_GLAL7|nr:hypothetical protein M7I_1014 [Glarea lozoyensis 74030]